MLSKLTIKNLALISELELDFHSGLNIMSGETGAGKSIIVDALMLLLGARYDKTLLRFGEQSGFVEGVFDITESVSAKLAEMGFDDDGIIIVNRRFTAEGKNEIRINGKMVTTSMLKTVMTLLVDIYGQNEYQSLTNINEHARILDFYCRNKIGEAKRQVAELFKQYKAIVKSLDELGNLSEREKNIDILRFQIEEIQAAKVMPNELEQINEQRKIIASAERISTALGVTANNLTESEGFESAYALIGEALSALNSISGFSDAYGELYERLKSVSIELDDISATAVSELNSMSFNEAEIDKLEKRYDLIMNLKRKYGAYDRMIQYLEQSKEELYKLENCTELYERLLGEKDSVLKQLYSACVALSKLRREGAKRLTERITEELSELGMNNCLFEVNFAELSKIENCEGSLTANGLDCVEFYLSPNPGQPLKPLVKIISGGEMSRFMLALKVITSESDDIPTLIFDEVDTGISGQIGQAVAKKLAKISRFHQVLCVTHLPQIASMADNHYFIEKIVENDNTVTKVIKLEKEGIIEEISRLSGSKDISSKAYLNAQEMKQWSDDYKSTL